MLTGFDAFGTLTTNPSRDLVNALARQVASTAVLPTSYQRAAPALIQQWSESPTDLIVMLGYSANASTPRIERTARNTSPSGVPDNDGVALPASQPILTTAPDRIQTAVPVDRLQARLAAYGHSCEVSDDAGGFVCNHTYFRALHELKHRDVGVVFIHIADDGPATAATVRVAIALLAQQARPTTATL